MKRNEKNSHSHISCQYCKGKGYFQLLLGGSETCERCSGTGKN